MGGIISLSVWIVKGILLRLKKQCAITVKALTAGQDAPPTVFEASRRCCTNSLHEHLLIGDKSPFTVQSAPDMIPYKLF